MKHADSRPNPLLTGSKVQSAINVTPLVDVVLVLLIIFMVVTPLIQKGVDVQLPELASPQKIAEEKGQVNVAIRMAGDIYVGANPVPAQAVKGQLEEIHANDAEKYVVLKADKRVKYKEVRNLMRTINEAGFPGVGLITLKQSGGG